MEVKAEANSDSELNSKVALDTIDTEANQIANLVHKEAMAEAFKEFDGNVQEAFLVLLNTMNLYPAAVVRMAVLSYICNWEEITGCECALCGSVNNVIRFVKAEKDRIAGKN